MKNVEIFIYSFIQGISEFLPISSSAHLYALESFFNWKVDGLTFALAAHLGSLIAVLFYEKSFLIKNVKSLLTTKRENEIFLLIICVLPVLFIGFLIIILFKESYKFSLNYIALSSIIGALLLALSDLEKSNSKKKEKLCLRDSIYIGIFQTLSLIPGMSRAGTVITMARYLGYTRSFSIKLALLTSIPIILLASLYGIYNVFISNQKIQYEFFLIALLTFIFAYFSIIFLLKWVKYFSFKVFVIYRIFFGILLIILAYS
ncbi:MAG: undecaprenyl-diphosphate phosphatase [Pseudomonadota bacterium]|nr:undecaprenyl-diphosphate phosphatase [Pseudomonadota bacterium]